jgi:hypothetical protein
MAQGLEKGSTGERRVGMHEVRERPEISKRRRVCDWKV